MSRGVIQAISLPVSLAKSLQGKYFAGSSDPLHLGNSTRAWAGLVNPCHSGVNLFVNVFTVTNVSPTPFDAEIWLNAVPPSHPQISETISPTNTALYPLPEPQVKLQFGEGVINSPAGSGIQLFIRRVPGESTLVSEEDGKFIIPPGGSFILFLTNPEVTNVTIDTRVAFGWWEEKRCSC